MGYDRNKRRGLYLKMEAKEIPNDYTNAFLNHFGFCDWPEAVNEAREIRKYNTFEQGVKHFEQ